ncbi:MAG: LamG domain-containing protein [Candidatus Hydrogenedentes bacterium]|nr:LamG domain-containing protein [Candidatus Hydrogenedentota bacterium]
MRPQFFFSALLVIALASAAAAQQAEPWESAYTGDDAAGEHVIAFWNFEGEGGAVADASGKGHDGVLDGAARVPEGRFGAGLASYPGHPVEDVRHAMRAPDAPELSPRGAFTAEMWIRPSEAIADYPDSFLLDKKYVAHDDYQWILGPADGSGLRRMRVVLGFGEDSETWWDGGGLSYEPGVWRHVAFTYDGAGTVQFFRDGRSVGRSTKPGRGPVHPGAHGLSIGDRVGSLYHGFPGTIDEVRLTEGAREFRPLVVSAAHVRTAWGRMEADARLGFTLTNARRAPLTGVTATVRVPGMPEQAYTLPELAPGGSADVAYALDTSLRPGEYAVAVTYATGPEETAYRNTDTFPVTIVPRQPPHRMPVVMWGVGGVEGVVEELPRLKELGFTHCLGLRCDYDAVWRAGAPVPAQDSRNLDASYRMLDRAFAEDFGVIISLGVGHWLDAKTELLRIGRDGAPYERVNPCCLTPGLLDFSKNVGQSVAQSYGDFPAFQAALINTEVRDSSQVCFHEHDRAAYRAATGREIPEEAQHKNGVRWSEIPDFRPDRAVPDDHELLQYYRWFWKVGDGWNAMHSAVHDGLREAGDDFWTFFDPAVRVPSIWGSGGNVDYLSHWTYSYPDPERIGLAADELFAMARGGRTGQDVMKMTQIIWYRSQTAPAEGTVAAAQSAWEDYDPDAAYITIAPAHLRQAFWSKIARPVKGIMYHGWQSLVPAEGGSVYRYTHPETRHALKELAATVVRPLGPTLLQTPAAPSDVAFLESFTSEMFAGRGTYGWGGSWGADAYHILRFAGLQPEIVFEESLQRDGLDRYRVLVLADCDVLPRSIVDAVRAFQQGGGIVVGDERLCPAIAPDITIPVYTRVKQADVDKAALLERAAALREQLAGRYAWPVRSSNPEVLTYRRAYGSSEYLFAINDHREFGSYVGSHGLVMENGLPATTTIDLARAGHVYDLVASREIPVTPAEDGTRFDLQLEPGGGRMLLVTARPIASIAVSGPEEAQRGKPVALTVTVADAESQPVDAVVPVELDIRDPDGRAAEFSGYYGAKDGVLRVDLQIAPNDTPGMWSARAREGATGQAAWHFFRVGGD